MAGCITPFCIRKKMTNQSVAVPCGRCPNCLARRVSGWSFRLMQEEKHSKSAFFVTLTYDTKHVPITRNGFMTLDKSSVQKFFKRLRKLQEDTAIKYYLCGEYGGKTNRPHYHVIMFNVLSISSIETAWNIGAVHYGAVTGASVGYTLKYMNKRRTVPKHRNDDRVPEFSLMSKGLGKSYLTDEILKFHVADLHNRVCLNIEDGKKIAMPRYYKDKIYLPEERVQIASWGKHLAAEEEANNRLRYKRGNYDRDKAEADMQAFRKLNLNASKRDNL